MKLWSLLLVIAAAARSADVRVTPGEQQEEARWLMSFGVKLPVAAWPLEDPFAQPFTRRSLVVPTAWYRQKQLQTLRADQFRDDIKLLRRIMETAYGGWQAAERRGWNWDAFFREWDDKLASRGSDELPIADAFATWRKFMEVQLDNHSGPVAGNFATVGHAFSWSAALSQAPAGACAEFRNSKGATFPIDGSDAAQQPKQREDIAGSPVYYIVTTNSKGPMESVHCGASWIPVQPAWMPEDRERVLNIRALAQTDKDVPVFRSISPRIGYIRFPSFSKAAVELTLKMEKSLGSLKRQEELLIVDLRGNGGGDMRIEALRNWSKFPSSGDSERRIGESCLYPALRWGYTQISSANLQPPVSSGRRSAMQNSVNALMKDDTPGCPAKFHETPGNWNYTQHRYPAAMQGKTRLLALVDDYCGSDCEGAVVAIASVPGSIIAGVNTFGVAQYIQPGYFVLPNTRLPFRIALGTSDHYGDGRSFDGYGFDVDIFLPTQSDQSPEGILRLAERLLPKR